MTPPTESRPKEPRTVVIGVLGGIASGKSAAARFLAGEGGVVLDADHLAHEALASDAGHAWVLRHVGRQGWAEGRPNRAAIARAVFTDAALRRELEALIHPRVRAELRSQLEAARSARAPRVVLDVPLLLENDSEHRLTHECDALVFVDADAKVRADRGRARGWSSDEIARREAAQLPLETKRARADFVLSNDGDLEDLRAAAASVQAQIEARRAAR